MSPRENAAQKAVRYLREGRVVLTRVDASKVTACVRGDGKIWDVTWERGRWDCTCPARTDQCAHARAVRLVVVTDIERGPR